MEKIILDSEFFNIEDTLCCGQTFRFIPYKNGYKVYSLDKCAYCYQEHNNTIIETEHKDYFYNYFDLDRDYSIIYNSAQQSGKDVLIKSSNIGKGIRILNQDRIEMIFSFIISQNNNIPRIKGIIEKLCLKLGEKKYFCGEEYYAFPTIEKLEKQTVEFYKSIGLGYRAEYIKRVAEDIDFNVINNAKNLSTEELKKYLISLHGIGPKVADCISLFGFHRTDSFPVDTWIEKVYKQDFNGELSDRTKITAFFVNKFKEYSGYFQQYLFYYKRSKEK
jgi:N-glycosylase/DNA lyase